MSRLFLLLFNKYLTIMKPAENYIINKQEPYQSILLHLQAIIESMVPNAKMLYKWRIPFYYFNDIPLCFLNQSKDYVDLGFWHVDKLTEYRAYFITKNRKVIASLRFKSVEDINDEVVTYVLKRQIEINTNPFKLILKPKK